MMLGSRTDIIMPVPALAIGSKKTQATFAVLLSRSVKRPKPLAERAKAAVWRGRYAPKFAEQCACQDSED